MLLSLMIYLGVGGEEIVGGELAALGVVKLEGLVALGLGVGVFSLIIDVLGLGTDPLGTVKLRASGAMLVVSNP
jgi:hypothetical protein